MDKHIQEFTNNILSLHPNSKRLIAILTDSSLCILYMDCIYFKIRRTDITKNFNYVPALISIIIAIPIFLVVWIISYNFSVYGFINNFYYFSIKLYIRINVFNYWSLWHPRSPKINWNSSTNVIIFAISSRLIVKFLLSFDYNQNKIDNKKNVLVYGWGCWKTTGNCIRQ